MCQMSPKSCESFTFGLLLGALFDLESSRPQAPRLRIAAGNIAANMLKSCQIRVSFARVFQPDAQTNGP